MCSWCELSRRPLMDIRHLGHIFDPHYSNAALQHYTALQLMIQVYQAGQIDTVLICMICII